MDAGILNRGNFTVLSWAHKGDDEPTVFSIRRNEDGTTFHCKVEKVESTIEPKEQI